MADMEATPTVATVALGRQASRVALALDAADEQRLEELCQPDGRVFWLALACHLGLWAAGLVALTYAKGQLGLQLGIALLMGSQLHALTVLQHDCGHRSAFRSPAWNLWVGRALAWFILLPFTSFTELHRRHHRHLGEAGLDPDNWFYAAGPRWTHWRECLFMPRFIWLSAAGPLSGATRRRVLVELAANLFLYGLLAAVLLKQQRPDLLLFGFGLPMLALASIFNPLARGAEHAPMSHLASLAPTDPRRQDLRFNTVTVAHRGWGLAWANITYHVEHHLHPRVPFHRLPALHDLMRKRVYLRTSSLWPFMRPPPPPGQQHH